MTSSVYLAGGCIFPCVPPRLEPAQWGVLKVALKCSSRGGGSVEGIVIVTGGCKSFIAPTRSGLLS